MQLEMEYMPEYEKKSFVYDFLRTNKDQAYTLSELGEVTKLTPPEVQSIVGDLLVENKIRTVRQVQSVKMYGEKIIWTSLDGTAHETIGRVVEKADYIVQYPGSGGHFTIHKDRIRDRRLAAYQVGEKVTVYFAYRRERA